MKRICLLFIASSVLIGQSTVFYTWNLQVSPGDTAVPISTTLDGAVALANFLFHNTQSQTTLSASCTSVATTCSLTSSSGIIVGNGICIGSCPVASATGGPPPTTFTLSGGEVALVTGINPLVLKRASIGTAVAGTINQVVTVLVAGSYTYQSANIFISALMPIIQGCNNGAYTTSTQCSAITAAQNTLNGVH